ncbi:MULTISPECIES: DUF3971 domain-containing protein [Alphaproteobacteria]|uniref:Membrane protein n=2 Tax=Alphaproteobacteria TaxID=28211 RepID=A0A512HCN5_9HYPH|nr:MULTISPECIES: DUF3971 domain-containing protein [Alphaproteobacteria]GEO83221.1 membrane protein [Ciceribacter naphthalenivorans]GLR20384.1 membrane protein [Ciceribacter naphthalenivorans]GLT03240.1 membrane protein [Sphingomonas psychrolutea]
MGEIRGEKVRFRKQDIVRLHELPSSRIEDPLIVHCPPRPAFGQRFLRYFFAILGLFIVAAGGVFAVVETGTLDRALSDGARAMLSAAVGPAFRAEIGETAIRFSDDFRLTVEARNVTIVPEGGESPLALTKSVGMILDPLALLGGKFKVNEIVTEGIALDARLLPAGPPLDLSALRVDGIPAILDRAFLELDQIQTFISRAGLDRMRIGGLEISTTSISGRPLSIAVDDLAMERGPDDSLSFFGAVSINGYQTEISALSANSGNKAQSFTLRLADVRLTPFLLRRGAAGDPRQGLDGSAEVYISAKRAVDGHAPAMNMIVESSGGTIYSDGQSQELTHARLNLGYDFKKDTLELSASKVEFGPMIMPLSGGVIDLDRLPGNTEQGAGVGIDLVVNEGRADVPAAGEAAFPFSLKLFGRYVKDRHELKFDRFTVSTPGGSMDASLGIRFVGTGPEVRFDALVRDMKTSVVKQLWPYWIAEKARHWVLANIFGGTIINGQISVFIPQDRLSIEPRPVHLDENELNLSFDIVDARMNLTGEIPPLRDASAHFDMSGQRIETTIHAATSYFPSGRSVKVERGELTLGDVYSKPLMADIDVSVSGAADAVAELVSFKPIRALERAGFAAQDFTGNVKGNAQIRLGLIADQNPPEPVWKAHLDLSGVDIAKPYTGRIVSDLDGKLDVEPKSARLEGNAKIDGVPMELRLTEPVDRNDPVARERVVKLKLDNEQRAHFVPGLNELINGPITVELSRIDDRRQAATIDLSSATLSVPWIGWSKGQGIGAKASFEVNEGPAQTQIDKFVLDGQGFGAAGTLVVGKQGLISADLNRVRLAPTDDYSLAIRQAKGGYDVSVSGKSADVRALITELRNSGAGGGDGAAEKPLNLQVKGQLDQVVGFGDEVLSGASIVYGARNGQTTALDISAVTDSRQAVVAKMRRPGELSELSVTTSDAGALARFINLYNRMIGGLMNLKLSQSASGSWSGSLDVRDFRVENEQRLQSIVTTPAGADGRSLNTAVKKNIDVSSARFQRAFARLVFADGALRVDNGVVRGEQVGATFQGLVRDARGRIDLTGTFMPAYGLNRLFGELPIIGLLLGNGRDRGLLGITFKLTGASEQPKLVVNPLSIIAPGVFRQIFEFR